MLFVSAMVVIVDRCCGSNIVDCYVGGNTFVCCNCSIIVVLLKWCWCWNWAAVRDMDLPVGVKQLVIKKLLVWVSNG